MSIKDSSVIYEYYFKQHYSAQQHSVMSKYFLFILAFWCYYQGHVFAQNDLIRNHLPMLFNSTHRNETTGKLNTPVVTMNGQNNYYVNQQIIYIYDQQYNQSLWDSNGNNNTEKWLAAGYVITPGIGVHKVHLDKLEWNKARRACVQEGGQLAIINSVSEEKHLIRVMQEKTLSLAWLGVHDLYEEGDWVTVTGVPLKDTGFTNWTVFKNNPQPDNGFGNENCATLYFKGGMNDGNCNSWKLPYFCEIST